MNGRCLVFEAPLQVSTGDIVIPEPGSGQLVTRTLLTGVSTGTETRVFRGQQPGSDFPLVPGYENLGEVVHAGPNTNLKVGDRLIVRDHCYDPGHYSLCWGSQVSHSVTGEGSAIRVPPVVADADAVFSKVAGISLHGVKRARVSEGEQVVVVGLGIIGHFVVQHAVGRGAKVVGVDLDEKRRALAIEAGANATVDASQLDAREQILELTRGGGNVVFDCTGAASVLETSAALLRSREDDDRGGGFARLVLQGTLEAPIKLSYRALFSPEADLIVPRDCDSADIEDSLALMASGIIQPSLLPVVTLPHEQASTGYEGLLSREYMRVHFTWS